MNPWSLPGVKLQALACLIHECVSSLKDGYSLKSSPGTVFYNKFKGLFEMYA